MGIDRTKIEDVARIDCSHRPDGEETAMDCKVAVYTRSGYGSPSSPNVRWPEEYSFEDVSTLKWDGDLEHQSIRAQTSKVEFDDSGGVCEVIRRGFDDFSSIELECS